MRAAESKTKAPPIKPALFTHTLFSKLYPVSQVVHSVAEVHTPQFAEQAVQVYMPVVPVSTYLALHVVQLVLLGQAVQLAEQAAQTFSLVRPFCQKPEAQVAQSLAALAPVAQVVQLADPLAQLAWQTLWLVAPTRVKAPEQAVQSAPVPQAEQLSVFTTQVFWQYSKLVVPTLV